VLVCFGVYFNALFGDFVHDDTSQIVENPWLKDIKNIPTLFTSGVWSFKPDLPISNYYRPMMHTLYMLCYQMVGLKPLVFHFVNILFHCTSSVLVYLLIKRLLATHSNNTSAVYLSPPFIAAVLFALHPIHTEAVTWISGLPEVAYTFFYLLSLYLYIVVRDSTRQSSPLSVLSFTVALLFKEPALTLPLVLIAYDFLIKKSQEPFLSVTKRYAPYIVVSAIYLIARYHALSHFVPSEFYPSLNTYQLAINIFPLFTEYLTSMIWPVNLNLWHTFHPISSLFEPKGILSAAVTLAFITASVYTYKKNKAMFFGFLLMALPLLPVFYIKAIGGKPFAERYLYLPSVGGVLLLSIFLSWVAGHVPRAAKGISIAFIMLAILFAAGTIGRNAIWRDNMTLWSDTVEKSPDSAVVHTNLGNEYQSRNALDKAITEYQTALMLDPRHVATYYNLGVAYQSKGQTDMAIEQFRATLSLKPNNAEAHNNLGVAYKSKGQTDRAIEEFKTALSLQPDNANAHNNLAAAYQDKGQTDLAAEQFRAAVGLRPDYAEAHTNLGNQYQSQGDLDKSIAEYQTALRLNPRDARIYYYLGAAYNTKGLIDMAIKQYRTALSLKSDYAEAHNSLGTAYQSKGQTDLAIEQFRTAVSLKPDYAQAHNNLGTAYRSKGQTDLAIEQFRTAVSLKPDYALAHNSLGVAYQDKGQTDMAIEQFKAALNLQPDFAQAHNNLGVAYSTQGLLNKAITEFKSALLLNPYDINGHYNLAISYRKAGMHNMERKEAEVILKIRPEHAGARRLLNDINSMQH